MSLYVALVLGLIVFVGVIVSPMVPLWSLRSNRLVAPRDQQQIAFVFSELSAMMVMFTVTSLGGRATALLSVMMALSAVIMNYRRVLVRQAARGSVGDPVPAEQASGAVPLPAT